MKCCGIDLTVSRASATDWLETELILAKSALAEIPLERRKGLAVGVLRKRARDTETALQLLREFEMMTCSKGD